MFILLETIVALLETSEFPACAELWFCKKIEIPKLMLLKESAIELFTTGQRTHDHDFLY